ncbi:MAG: T9SS type B sorting domain-containing protein [Cryomorphaceae bacterium]|nr:T9SS type B sorting domain-containing protein [Cryomorphaceae bacterium]
MKKTLVLFCVLTSAIVSMAQTTPLTSPVIQESAITGADLIKKYRSLEMAVFQMTRDEWEIFRAWEGYDKRAIEEIIDARKAEYTPTANLLKNSRMVDDCDCWIEPDETYEEIITADWNECGGGGIDVDCWFGPVFLEGWNFNLYGNNYNSIYINSKGTISFGAGFIDWTPDEFPGSTYNQVAGFWADFDFRTGGQLFYKVTPEATYINYVNVGYWNNQGGLRNTFQITITPSTGGVLGDDKNVQICFQDMQWAHGDVGGGGGFGGPNPAVVGADVSAASGPNIQFGRFNLNNSAYNGPYGAANNQQDGVHWLDYKTFEFSTVGAAQSNIPPISTGSFGCDTLIVCLNDTLPIDISFLAPETNQQVSINVAGDLNGYSVINQTNGNTAALNAIFVGSTGNLGIHDITITATDTGNPAGVTVVDLVINVIDVELPPLTIAGDLSLCPGQTAELSASPGFDSYSWTNGCDSQDCSSTIGGAQILTATYQGCEAVLPFTLVYSAYFNPPITIVSNPTCSDVPAVVTVTQPLPNQPQYVDYMWEGDWNGGGGEIISDNDDVAEVSCGIFRLVVENDLGCLGQRVFIVECVDAFIPDDIWSGAYCDGIEPVTFDGGFSEPAEGNLTIYLQSSNTNGWNGSYAQLYIDGEPYSPSFTITNTFGQFIIPIEFGQLLEIEYVSAPGTTDANNTIQLFNCAPSNSSGSLIMSPGIVYSSESGCNALPAFGEWTVVSGPAGGIFSDINQYNSTFTPAEGAYGLYEICFAEESCNIQYCYELEYTQEPTISLSTNDVTLCGTESATINATITDLGGTATINWPAPGTDNVLTNTYSFNTPQNINSQVTITNGCGNDSAPLNISVQSVPQTPVLTDAILCDGGTVPFDPITGAADTPDLVYSWTLNNAVISTDDAILAAETGTYCVNISNDCLPNGVSDCADVSISAPLNQPVLNFYADCDGDGQGTIFLQNMPNNNYIVEWPDGSSGYSWTVSNSGLFDVTITDPGNCFTETFNSNVFIGVAPTINPEPTTAIVLCPEIQNTFSMNSPNSIPDGYVWTVNCGNGVTLSGNGDDLVLSSANLSTDCWGQVLTLTGTASNPCGSVSSQFDVFIDACEITIPNVITPNGDSVNDTFKVEGLDVYNNVFFNVFNRWGGLVYENENYRSGDFNAREVEDGTYFYVLVLPNGREHKGSFTVSR